MANRKIGKYEILERLGRGGMAEVYRGYHANLDRYVAIKVLHTFLADEPEFKERFEKEAQSIARLKHPHIVQVYDFDYDVADDVFYMVMELIEGPSLKQRLAELTAKGARLPFGDALRIMQEAASALAYAHGLSMIHRDVKPANLMLDHGKRTVLTDFGIAKILTGQQFTTTGGMVGTPAYMAPEHGMGATGDERSDLYSLGVILFEMVTGRLPYEAQTPVAMILQHVHSPVPSACALNPALPKAIDRVLVRLLAKKPEDRYQKVGDLMEDFERLKAGMLSGDDIALVDTRPLEGSSSIRQASLPGPSGAADSETVILTPDSSRPVARPFRKLPWWAWAGSVAAIIFVVFAGLSWGAGRGAVGAALLPSPTTTMTIEPTTTPTLLPSRTPTATPTNTATKTATSTATQTPTSTTAPSLTPAPTSTNVSVTVISDTPLPSPNATETFAYVRTATVAACRFDYALVSQEPADGADGGFFPVNTVYERQIVLRNTGNCPWEPNTALTYVEGEDFNAETRTFIRESVESGAQVTVTFTGMLPGRGSLTPLVGTWELRTPGQIRIGQPLQISILVYDPGS